MKAVFKIRLPEHIRLFILRIGIKAESIIALLNAGEAAGEENAVKQLHGSGGSGIRFRRGKAEIKGIGGLVIGDIA